MDLEIQGLKISICYLAFRPRDSKVILEKLAYSKVWPGKIKLPKNLLQLTRNMVLFTKDKYTQGIKSLNS